MTTLQIEQFNCRTDNFGVLIHDTETGATASIDAPEENPILDVLEQRGWQLTHILCTHHHMDHVAANRALKEKFGVTIIGPRDEADKIPGIDIAVGDGDHFKFEEFDVDVIATPGHTLGHICYYLPGAETAFVGDTLFAMGCGRIFEGTAQQMYHSLQKLAALPEDTVVYCGHEYTEANTQFALTIDPGNQQLVQRAADVNALRATGKPTLPTSIGLEEVTNPFLRTDDPAIRHLLGMEDDSDEAVFAEIRRRKDVF